MTSMLTRMRHFLWGKNDGDKTFAALSAVLVVSIAVNAYFVQRFVFPEWRNEIRIAFASAPEARPNERVDGDESAPATIIVYSDFQCPYCARLHGVLRQLAQDKEIRWIFRHYTLNPGHPESAAAANAAECAGAQGRFWEYADGLFEKQASLGAETYMELAEQLHLQVEPFRACMTASEHQAVIDSDNAETARLALMGTPTWFVNGKRKAGAMDIEQVRRIIRNAG